MPPCLSPQLTVKGYGLVSPLPEITVDKLLRDVAAQEKLLGSKAERNAAIPVMPPVEKSFGSLKKHQS